MIHLIHAASLLESKIDSVKPY